LNEYTFPDLQGISTDYDRDGFVIVRNVLEAGLVLELDRHIDWLMDRHPELQPEGLGHWLIADDPFWVRFLSDPTCWMWQKRWSVPMWRSSLPTISASNPKKGKEFSGTRTVTTGRLSRWTSLRSGSLSRNRYAPTGVCA